MCFKFNANKHVGILNELIELVLCDNDGLSYVLGDKGDLLKCTEENNVMPISLKVPVTTRIDKKGEFDIFLHIEDERASTKMLRMMDVGDEIQINGPHGDCKYLGHGTFFFNQLKKTRKFKRLLVITENEFLSHFLGVIQSEANIDDEWSAMDLRVIYFLNSMEQALKIGTLVNLQIDRL